MRLPSFHHQPQILLLRQPLIFLAFACLALSGAAAVRYVAPGGNGGGVSPVYASLQAAVDAAATGDEIRVASGTYSGVTSRSGSMQHVLIGKTLVIRGGYSVGQWSNLDPKKNKAILDAKGQGRVLYITGGTSLVYGLYLTGGKDTSTAGGGGVAIGKAAAPALRNNTIYRNTAASGGGIASAGTGVTLENNIITSNTVTGYAGGGLYLTGKATVRNNTVAGNRIHAKAGNYFGGGIAIENCGGTITGNTIHNNRSLSIDNILRGGGISSLRDMARADNYPVLNGNTVTSNTADEGGGVYLQNDRESMPPAVVSGNTISSNSALFNGGGVRLGGGTAILQNNSICFNRLTTPYLNKGAGVAIIGSMRGTTFKMIDNTVADNQTSLGEEAKGGGIYGYIDGQFSGNTIQRNQSMLGGGVYFENSPTTFSANRVLQNSATVDGGGMVLVASPALLHGNTISSNTVSSDAGDVRGGGLYLNTSAAVLSGNTIQGNRALANGLTGVAVGGGIYMDASPGALGSNAVTGNRAGNGGGIYIRASDASLSNTLVADNTIKGLGAGMFVSNSSPRLVHTTVARNRGGDGSGLFLAGDNGQTNTATLTNTILTSQTTGVIAGAQTAVSLTATLWGVGRWANGADFTGIGGISTVNDFTGDPAFVNPQTGNYRLDFTSAAVDRGVATSVGRDQDGHKRPVGKGMDLGAYEWSDPAAMIDYLLGKRTLTTAQKSLLDLNEDGKVTIADVVNLTNQAH